MADTEDEDLYGMVSASDIPASFLSPRFKQMICEVSISHAKDDNCLSAGKLLNWPHLQTVIPEERVNDCEYFMDCAKILAPWLCSVHHEMNSWSLEDFRKYHGNYIGWTGNCELIEECFLLSLKERPRVLQALLTLTALLERSLGDVYLLRGRQCPSLLKDLLVTEELTNSFSPLMMQFLRILIGPSISINIRNVVWHGFLSSDEAHPQFCHILLAIIASFGHHLNKLHSSPGFSIAHRSPVCFHDWSDLQLDSDLIIHNTLLLQNVFKSASVVTPSMLPSLIYTLDLVERKRYGHAMILLLPQLEMSCRLVFTTANRCHQRLLTAEATELFTTFDEMLQKFLPNGDESRMLSYFDEGIMKCLLDLLTYPEGPRVRDRISHGECDIANFPGHLAVDVLTLYSAICIKALPKDSSLLSNEVIKQISKNVEGYQSQYHPIKLLYKEISEVVNSLSTWKHCPRPKNDEIEYNDWESLILQAEGNGHLNEAAVMGNYLFSEDIINSICASFGDLTILKERIRILMISTLYRNQSTDHLSASSEEEVVGLCRRIMQHCLTVSHQVKEGLSARYLQWVEKSLRSRQRNTYVRMLQSIPDISRGLRSLLLFIVTIYISFEERVRDSSLNKKRIKNLKQALQYVENMVTFTSQDKNRWEEAQKSTNQFHGKILTLLKSV